MSWLYRLAGVKARCDGPTIAELLADGWEVCSAPSPWGSVWMRRAA